ncbi:MAG: xylulokinase [Fimbriimonadales bacterium]|nr:xylulokinase [Fimbriimonadales bacterium]
MARLLGIDVGTSGTKAVLIDETGAVLAQASAEYPISTPRPLWSEQDPEDWWRGVESCLRQIGQPDVDAVGLSGQMHGSVFLDERDRVIRPAILWNDQRTAEECADIDRIVGRDRVREITGNPPVTGFQAPKILWLRKHEPEAFQRVRSILLPKDYVRFRLTGEKFTEVSDASGVGLFDVPGRRWSDEMLAALDLDPSLFPPAVESYEAPSKTLAGGCLSAGIPVAGGGGDQAAGAVGTGAVAPGVVSASLGTSGVVFSALAEPNRDPDGTAQMFCHANGAWHAMGVVLSCGGALRWYRDTLGAGASYDDLAREAAEAPPGAEGATFLPYLTGERCPYQDPLAKAAFAGLTLAHSRRHLSRAVFEGVSFALLDCMNLLRKLGAEADEVRVTGGGAKSAFWLGLLADLFQRPCVTLEHDEGPAYGAAILGGVAIGVWPSVREACARVVRLKGRIEPSGAEYSRAYERYRRLYAESAPWMHGA